MRNRSNLLSPEKMQRKHKPDYILLLLVTSLIVLGLIVVYSISPGLSATQHVSGSYYVTKQIVAILLGFIAFIICSAVPTNKFRYIRNYIVAAALFSAGAVQLFGTQVNGAYRWIQIGGFSFQAVELIKFALVFYVAELLATRMKNGDVDSFNKTIKPLIIIVGLIAIVVAGFQSDLGSSAVMMAIIAVMGFTAGMKIKKIASIALIVFMVAFLGIASSGYRRARLSTFLHPAKDCQNAGYQACQALNAIGSGGMFGLGLGKGVQAYGYLPEAANDSIFAIIAEKFGFVGVSVVMAIFLALFGRIKRIIERSYSTVDKLIATGILTWFSFQAIINIAAMIGLMPLKGITLPFISYGGTSIVFVMGAVGLIFQISKFTSYSPVKNSEENKERRGNDYTTLRRGDRRPYYAPLSRRP